MFFRHTTIQDYMGWSLSICFTFSFLRHLMEVSSVIPQILISIRTSWYYPKMKNTLDIILIKHRILIFFLKRYMVPKIIKRYIYPYIWGRNHIFSILLWCMIMMKNPIPNHNINQCQSDIFLLYLIKFYSFLFYNIHC